MRHNVAYLASYALPDAVCGDILAEQLELVAASLLGRDDLSEKTRVWLEKFAYATGNREG
jgi:hypothetical protein